MLGYNLVDDGLGRFLIVVKFHGEEALAACHEIGRASCRERVF